MEKNNTFEIIDNAMFQINGLVNNAMIRIKEEVQRNPENSQFLMDLLTTINTIADYNDHAQSNLCTLPEMTGTQIDVLRRAEMRQEVLQDCRPETENSRAFH